MIKIIKFQSTHDNKLILIRTIAIAVGNFAWRNYHHMTLHNDTDLHIICHLHSTSGWENSLKNWEIFCYIFLIGIIGYTILFIANLNSTGKVSFNWTLSNWIWICANWAVQCPIMYVSYLKFANCKYLDYYIVL